MKVLTPKLVASEGFVGRSIAEEDGRPDPVVNAWGCISAERWTFTAAHEFVQLILHPGAYDVTNTEENKVEKDEANVLATAEGDQAAVLKEVLIRVRRRTLSTPAL